MMDGLSSRPDVHLAPWAPGTNLAVRVQRAFNDRPVHAAGCHLLSVAQAAINTEFLNPALANSHRLKRTLSNLSLLA